MLPILITFASQNVRVRRSRHDVRDVLMFRQDVRQRLDYVFNPLVRREQPEGKQYSFPFHAKAVLIEIGIQKWQVGNAVRNHVNLAARHLEDFLQELRREFAHHNQTVGQLSDLFHNQTLVRVRFAENRVKGRHHGHLQPT